MCFLIVCLLWNLGLLGLEFKDYGMLPSYFKFGKIKREPIVDDMRRLSVLIPDEAIVLTTTRTSWPLPTFTGKVVSLLDINPMVADHYRRRKDTHRFFHVETTQETRLEILKRYKITHILFKERNIHVKVRNSLNDFGYVTKKMDGYIILELPSIKK